MYSRPLVGWEHVNVGKMIVKKTILLMKLKEMLKNSDLWPDHMDHMVTM